MIIESVSTSFAITVSFLCFLKTRFVKYELLRRYFKDMSFINDEFLKQEDEMRVLRENELDFVEKSFDHAIDFIRNLRDSMFNLFKIIQRAKCLNELVFKEITTWSDIDRYIYTKRNLKYIEQIQEHYENMQALWNLNYEFYENNLHKIQDYSDEHELKFNETTKMFINYKMKSFRLKQSLSEDEKELDLLIKNKSTNEEIMTLVLKIQTYKKDLGELRKEFDGSTQFYELKSANDSIRARVNEIVKYGRIKKNV